MPVLNDLLDGAAPDEFHDHANMIVFLRQFIERRDIGMIEAPEALRLGEETIDEAWVARELRTEEFDRDFASDFRVDSRVHFAGAPGGEPFGYPVLAYCAGWAHGESSDNAIIRVAASAASIPAMSIRRVAICVLVEARAGARTANMPTDTLSYPPASSAASMRS